MDSKPGPLLSDREPFGRLSIPSTTRIRLCGWRVMARLGFEGVAASAACDRIGIVNVEASSHEISAVIYRGPRKVSNRHRIDEYLEVIEGKTEVILMRFSFKSHPILQTGTASTSHENPQRIGLTALLLHQHAEVLDCCLSHENFIVLYLNIFHLNHLDFFST